MAIQFKISAERFIDVCSVTEYLGVLAGMPGSQFSALPKFLLDDHGKFIVLAIHDEEGDIKEYKNLPEAQARMDKANLSIPRFEKLKQELTKAARDIVNPPKGEGSTKPSPQ